MQLVLPEVVIWRHDPAVLGISTEVPRAYLDGLHPLLSVLLEGFGTHPAAAQDSGFTLSGGLFRWTATHVSRDAHQREFPAQASIFASRVLPDAWNFRGQACDRIRITVPADGADPTGFSVEGSEVRIRATVRPAVAMSRCAFDELARRVELIGPSPVARTDDD